MIDRRRFVGWGALGLVGATVPAARRLVFGGRSAVYLCEPGDLRLASSVSSSAFTQPLRIPSVLVPRTEGGVDHYEIEMRAATAEILPGKQTPVITYAGQYPGPTIVARRGRPVEVTFANALDVDTSIHLHGGHVAPDMDGHPNLLIRPGESRRYRYPNEQAHATLWYHDHAMHETAENVYAGLAAFYLLRDDEEEALGLPSGQFDVPLMLQDRAFNADGTLRYPDDSDPASHDGFTGDTLLVNGVAQPVLEVNRARYRFRIVNGANTRMYELRLSTGRLRVIGSDGGLLAAPVDVDSVTLGVAERVEVVVDFTSMTAGATLDLRDELSGQPLLRFAVGSATASGGNVPAQLRVIEPLPAPVREREIRMSFDAARMEWVLDGKTFDPARIDARPRLGSTELWKITNESKPGRDFVHPFHLHLVMFQVQKRINAAGVAVSPPAHERGWKDTVRVHPGETVTLLARFDGFTGTYLYHCHILEHEDHSMMAQFRVVDLARRAGADRIATAAAISAGAFEPGVPVAFVATGFSFADALSAGPAAASAGGPVLLTAPDALPDATKAELQRLGPGRIVVVGGPAAVSPSVEAELDRFTAGPVERIAGGSRYETSAAIALAHFDGGVPVAYVATGAAFPDALGGGAAAAAAGGPVLLTERDVLPAPVEAALRELAPGRVVVLGGPNAVSDAVETRLREIAPVERVAGASRYDTAVAVSADAFPDGAATAFVATGESFPDALAGVPAAGMVKAPLLLVPPSGLPDAVAAELRRLRATRIVVLGGPGAVPPRVEDELAELL